MLKLISRSAGWFARARRPRFFSRLLVRTFASSFGLNLSEAEQPNIAEFPSLADLFVRRLKKDARKIESGLVSPVDGTLRSCGPVCAGVIPQIKGKNYSVIDLVGCPVAGEALRNGYYFNLYLSPKDYHRIHSPCTWSVEKVVDIPGTLWPVNDLALRYVSNLFLKNERRVLLGSHHAYGRCALVMVGALNVGQIEVWLPGVSRFCSAGLHGASLSTEVTFPIKTGDLVGTFHLGSSVVLLVERPDPAWKTPEFTSRPVQFGQVLGK